MGVVYQIAWWVALSADAIAVVGLVALLLALPSMKGALRSSMTLLFIGAFFAIGSSSSVAVLMLLRVDFLHEAWNLLPIMFPIAMVFYVISMRTLLVFLEDLTG